MRNLTPEEFARLHYNDAGLIPVIAQDDVTGHVLMLAWANEEALRASLKTGNMTYWSRSRNALWAKGETSGHTQTVVSLSLDCDQDAILARVRQEGPACHTGAATCWHHQSDPADLPGILGALDALMRTRKRTGEGYTGSLVQNAELAASKVVEEAQEVQAVLRGEDNDDTLEHEAADLLYHLLAAIQAGDVELESVLRELDGRR